MLNDRKKQILQAIIEEYIQTAEPVSSNAIVQKYNLDYSSATVRNEMADLEKAGYLEKTHTSSGRIPSEKGYRYYVDHLMKPKEMNGQEVLNLKKIMKNKLNLKKIFHIRKLLINYELQKKLKKIWKVLNQWIDFYVEMLVMERQKLLFVLYLKL